jgi:integrase
LVESARSYASEARSSATRRAYRADWQAWSSWCAAQGACALPAAPEALACYLAELADAGRRPSTIGRALAGISEAHRAAGLDSPRGAAAVRLVMRGIRRRLGVAPRQKAPILPGELRAMVAELPDGLRGLRDRALLLVGFAGAFRRSELVGLDAGDVVFTPDGAELALRRSKTDQNGEGRKIGLPYGSTPPSCPVRALRAWIEAAGISEGPVFRAVVGQRVEAERLSDRAVARLVKRAARAVGRDTAALAGHSLRAGLATAAAKAGKSERAIMRQTGHKSAAMVRRYIRDAELFTDNAAAGLL